jgi:magnesium transporter
MNIDEIKDYLFSRDYTVLRKLFRDYEIADIAEVLSSLSVSHSIMLFRLVPRAKRSNVFSHMEIERQKEFIKELPDLIVSALLNEMEPDDRTSLLEDVSVEVRDHILLKLDPDERKVAWKLLSYPEDSVGRLMTPEVLSLQQSMTVSAALSKIQWSKTLPPEFLHYLFVVDETGSLIGEVSLAELVISDPPNQPLVDIMHKNYIYLDPYQPSSEAIESFRKYDRHYIPVTDKEKKLIGIVTSDDVFDLAEEEATEDIQQFGGQGALEESYFQTPFLTMLKKRTGWLAILFIGGFFSCAALKGYEELLSKWAFLVFFLPIITSAGGNSGTQAASLIIRGLAIKEMSSQDVWKVLKKEIPIGVSLGLVLALIGFTRAITWNMGLSIATIIACSVVVVVVFGVVAGSMLPFVFEKLKLDPAVVSSPFISTLLDVTGIFVFIKVALFIMSFTP